MKSNSRLSLALHALSHMAGESDRYWTSAEIAEHAGTNPVVVRRALGKLAKAGFLLAKKGHSGGWRLACDPNDISLADIYLALEEGVFAASQPVEPTKCSLETALHEKVAGVLTDIEGVLIARLGETSIAEITGHETAQSDPARP